MQSVHNCMLSTYRMPGIVKSIQDLDSDTEEKEEIVL